jgi:hypothetical protein
MKTFSRKSSFLRTTIFENTEASTCDLVQGNSTSHMFREEFITPLKIKESYKECPAGKEFVTPIKPKAS